MSMESGTIIHYYHLSLYTHVYRIITPSPSSSSSLLTVPASSSSNPCSGYVSIAAIFPSPSNLFPLSCSELSNRTSPPSSSRTLSTNETHRRLSATSCARNNALLMSRTPPPRPTAPWSTALSTSRGPYHARPSSCRMSVRN